MAKQYYIRNEGYVGNSLIWWMPNHNGYTTDIRKAGKYTYDEAKEICNRPQDTAYEVEYIDNLEESHKLTIDCQYVDSSQQLFKP